MSPVTRIALRRIKRDLGKSILLMVAIFFSMQIISSLLFFEFTILPIQENTYQALPIQMFLGNFRGGINITVVCLILLAILTIRMHCGIRREENRQTLAVLTSIGAVNRQIGKLVWVDIGLLYVPPAVLGVIGGMLPCMLRGKSIQSEGWQWIQFAGLAVVIIATGVGLIILCNLFPQIRRKRRSVIGTVKKHNEKATGQNHSYRQSRTYKSQAIVKRLAKKSVDYYSKTYNGIAITFAAAALYPILAVLLFWYVGNADVLLETYQQEEIAAALRALEQIFVFLGIGFAVLTAVGILQAYLMASVQFAARQKSAHIYLSIGMPVSDIHRMIRAELKSVVIRTVIMLIFSTYLLNACFAMVMGGI